MLEIQIAGFFLYEWFQVRSVDLFKYRQDQATRSFGTTCLIVVTEFQKQHRSYSINSLNIGTVRIKSQEGANDILQSILSLW